MFCVAGSVDETRLNSMEPRHCFAVERREWRLSLSNLACELVRGVRQVHVDVIEVSESKMVRTLRGLGIAVTIDNE